jgi:hypothetical protein
MGLGAPLSVHSSEKTVLQQPIGRGAYALASKDRKTVIKMLVLGTDEAGFDPEVFARSSMASFTDEEIVARIRGTWNLAQMTFESHDPSVYPAMDFFLGLASRMASLADGVVADPVSQRYRLPNEVFVRDRLDPRIDARDHVSVKYRVRPDGVHAYTLGMQKFNLHEYEVHGLFDGEEGIAEAFLLAIAQRVLTGDLTKAGDRFGVGKTTLEAQEGGFDRGLWDGIPVFELLPPTSLTAGACMRNWADSLP